MYVCACIRVRACTRHAHLCERAPLKHVHWLSRVIQHSCGLKRVCLLDVYARAQAQGQTCSWAMWFALYTDCLQAIPVTSQSRDSGWPSQLRERQSFPLLLPAVLSHNLLLPGATSIPSTQFRQDLLLLRRTMRESNEKPERRVDSLRRNKARETDSEYAAVNRVSRNKSANR